MSDASTSPASSAFDGATRALLEDVDITAQGFHRRTTLPFWLKLGEASEALQRAALLEADATSGPKYAAAWGRLVRPYPHLMEMDKASRSRAIWLYRNWHDVGPWLDTLPYALRNKLASPSAIKSRYEAAQRSP